MQTQNIVEEIRHRLSGIADLYHRLVLLVGPSRSGKTTALRALAKADGLPLVNLGVDLSERLLDLTERQRALQAPRLLEEVAASVSADVVLLDNTDILFASALRQDPLRLLQGASRRRTIVAAWLGTVDGGYLTYAVPEHPEFRRYPLNDLMIVALGQGDRAEQVQR
ncbi:MAG TPA: BREX-3 system P-loop-containing protein BrxF [Acidobacteriaceae bacterium]|nr:BREX-3 system P-loop-containing protein BrxF [Acidobacteriaceae bacterium]